MGVCRGVPCYWLQFGYSKEWGMSKNSRRVRGTGAVYQRASDGMWIGSIEAGYTRRGTRRRITVSASTEKLAKQKLVAKQRELARQGIPEESVAVRATVKAYGEEWLERRKASITDRAYTSDATAFNRWIVPVIGNVRLSNLSSAHVRAVSKACINAGLAQRSASRYVGTFKTLINDAIRDGYIVPQSAQLAEMPKRGEVDRDRIPLAHIALLLKTADTLPIKWRARWYVAFFLGMRPAEVRGLRWEKIDFLNERIEVWGQLKALPRLVKGDRASGYRIPAGRKVIQLMGGYHIVPPKTASGRRVLPMIEPVKSLLQMLREATGDNPYGLLFPSDCGTPMSEREDRDGWKALCEAAGVRAADRDYVMYEARHSTASLLASARVPESAIRAIMGHASINSTEAYLHADIEEARHALEGLARVIETRSNGGE